MTWQELRANENAWRKFLIFVAVVGLVVVALLWPSNEQKPRRVPARRALLLQQLPTNNGRASMMPIKEALRGD